METQHISNQDGFIAWCLSVFLICTIAPFGSAWAICEDGCPGLPPWCQDGVPDDCKIESVGFEIKPYSSDRCLKLDGNGVIPVLILGQAYLHVEYIDTTTLSLNGLEVRMRGSKGPLCSINDSNHDGYPDLFCQFEDDPSQWIAGNAVAELSGLYLDGTTQIFGSGTICVQ